MSDPTDLASRAKGQPVLRAVAMPTEHGGWGLTLEPVLLGVVVAPSTAGFLLGAAAFLAFLLRTPLKVVLVDVKRHRTLRRTRIAVRVVLFEALVLAGLVVAAAWTADSRFWIPALVAAPLIAVELWYDMRSRSRRLMPELAGAVGIAAVVAMIALAGGESAGLSTGLWCVLGARSVTAIPHVRQQIAILHRRPTNAYWVAGSDATAIAIAVTGVTASTSVLAGAVAVALVVGAQYLMDRRPIPAAKIIGLRQMALGLFVVAVTAVGVLA